MKGFKDWMTPERGLALQGLGLGISQLAHGQPVNLSSAHNALYERQQNAERKRVLSESGILDRFSPDQQAILAQMPPNAAMKIIAGEAFKAPDEPTKGIAVGDNVVNPVTGQVIYEAPDEPEGWRTLPPEEVEARGLDTEKVWQEGLSGANKGKVSPVGGSLVDIDMGNDLSPGWEAVDKKFAENYLDWKSGGLADSASQAAQIGSVLEDLEAGKPLTGPGYGMTPEFFRALTNPEAADAQARVESVVQRSLKETLGAQFTAQEGAQLIARAYDPKQPPERNAARLRALFKQIEAAATAKQAMLDHFDENGTLRGYKGPSIPTISDFEQALEIPDDQGAAPTPVENEMLSNMAERYGVSVEQIWENLSPEAREALSE